MDGWIDGWAQQVGTMRFAACESNHPSIQASPMLPCPSGGD